MTTRDEANKIIADKLRNMGFGKLGCIGVSEVGAIEIDRTLAMRSEPKFAEFELTDYLLLAAQEAVGPDMYAFYAGKTDDSWFIDTMPRKEK